MIVCVMDDLMASINISSLAKSIGGIDLYFERTPDNVIASIREKQPALVIFDLNSRKMEPMAAIRIMKAEPDLESITTIGFVSHVDAGTVAAARQAGIDQVLARSAFFGNLRQILTGASATTPPRPAPPG
jgi:PleD family two-component response regulator